MFPGNFVATTPDKVAVVRPATGESITYAELDRLSTKVAHYLRDDLGLGRGDNVSIVSNNDIRVLVIYWAAVELTGVS